MRRSMVRCLIRGDLALLSYGSVCSGIEAASVAWEPLGWKPEWFAEIEPFPSAVLAHHWPHVPNLGDMTKIAGEVANDNVPAPDVLVGGTPCQAFSVAGARKGLEDERGFLTIKFVELANAIDQQRSANDNQPAIIVWENVPGVLSSKDNAFGAFLGLLSGEDCELVPPGGKWSNAGYVHGPQRTIAWRILDAQYFGVAQRRRRVFVVASAREGFDPTTVLFEREGMRRDTAPSREAGTVVAALTANGVGTCGADDNQGQAGHLIPTEIEWRGFNFDQFSDGGVLSPTLTATEYKGKTFVYPALHTHGQENAVFHTTGAGWWNQDDVSGTLRAREQESHEHLAISVSLRGRDGGATAELGDEVAGCLRASSGGGDKPHVLAYSLTPWEQQGRRIQSDNGVAPTLMCNPAGGMKLEPVLSGLAVRRLMPVECERLQGFPDCHTQVPYRGNPASDGPRYKAIGNSMAVPCMAWIGKRIEEEIGRA